MLVKSNCLSGENLRFWCFPLILSVHPHHSIPGPLNPFSISPLYHISMISYCAWLLWPNILLFTHLSSLPRANSPVCAKSQLAMTCCCLNPLFSFWIIYIYIYLYIYIYIYLYIYIFIYVFKYIYIYILILVAQIPRFLLLQILISLMNCLRWRWWWTPPRAWRPAIYPP